MKALNPPDDSITFVPDADKDGLPKDALKEAIKELYPMIASIAATWIIAQMYKK